MTKLIGDRAFERMVSADLRDKDGVRPGWAVLRSPINQLRWLTVLVGIRERISAQNAHENAALIAHPDRAHSGGPTSPAYAEAKAAHADRKRVRMRAMQAVKERITEAQQLIGTLPVSQAAAGRLVLELIEIDRILGEGSIEDARVKLRLTIQAVAAEGENQ